MNALEIIDYIHTNNLEFQMMVSLNINAYGINFLPLKDVEIRLLEEGGENYDKGLKNKNNAKYIWLGYNQ